MIGPTKSKLPQALDARTRRTRASLDRTLLTLLGHKPFERITIREIARRAGIGYATFFRHYSGKESLLNAVAAHQIRDLLAQALPILFAANSRAACRSLCVFVDRRRRLWRALLTGGAAAIMRAEFVRQARAIAAQRPGPRGWLPDDLKVVYGVGGTIDVLAWWLQQRRALPAARIARVLDRLVITPVLSKS